MSSDGASSSTTPQVPKPLEIKQVNESLYELYRPTGTPQLQIVFFHGLQLDSYTDAHLSAWKSADGSCVWPQKWLTEDFPRAHVLTVSYGAAVERRSQVSMDLLTIGENLVSDLMEGDIGQIPFCPVILVGHSLGGLIIKEVCRQAHHGLAELSHGRERAKLQVFLESVRGIFFYATPHHGSDHAKKLTNKVSDPLLPFFSTFSVAGARLNQEFNDISALHDRWRIAGLGEGLPTRLARNWGPDEEVIIVPEASARVSNFYLMAMEDHFSISKPKSKNSKNFYKLVEFVADIKNEHLTKHVHQCQGLPRHGVDLQCRVGAVQKKLETPKVLGIVGMGGIGKTTLAKAVFNSISGEFECTCFVENVKGIPPHKLQKSVLGSFYRHGRKINSSKFSWRDLERKKTLFALDDVDSELQLKDLPELKEFGDDSRVIITTRNENILSCLESCHIYKVDFLESDQAEDLLCQYAELKEVRDSLAWRESKVKVVVEKCGGLPLMLEVLGCYLRGHVDDPNFWEQTTRKLGQAESIGGNDKDRLWESLRVSYDGLAPKEQEMFIEAAIYFFEQPLDQALAAWSGVNKGANTRCLNLMSRSMLKVLSETRGGIEVKTVWVHEQLRDLAVHVANKNYVVSRQINNIGEMKAAMDFLNSDEVDVNTKILRVRSWPGMGHLIELEFLDKLRELKCLEVSYCIPAGPVEKFPRKLSLLSWKVPSGNSPPLFPQTGDKELSNLGVLELEGWEVPKEFPEALENLTNLRILSLGRLRGLHHLPQNLGNLSQLKQLTLERLDLRTLPESLGGLLLLEELVLDGLHQIKCLPESFCRLQSLKKLEISSDSLEMLPDSLGQLASLQHLEIGCSGLTALPDTLGDLVELVELRLDIEKVKALPKTLGRLVRLVRLSLRAEEIVHLRIGSGNLTDLDLEDLVLSSEKWFSSLKSLELSDCWIGSMQVTSLLEAMMKVPVTELALKTLDLSQNRLDDRAVVALALLADSGKLPHLKELNLSNNLRSLNGQTLVILIQSLRSGGLPGLQTIDWQGNDVDDGAAEAIVEAYVLNNNLTANIIIDWDKVKDPSIRTKLETCRDRNVRLTELARRGRRVVDNSDHDMVKVGEDDLKTLTSARVFLCGYPEVGKTTLRETLLDLGKCQEGEKGPDVVKASSRKSLIHSFGKWSCCLRTPPPNEEPTLPNEETARAKEAPAHPYNKKPRTRGIEISRVEEKGNGEDRTTLVLWDLAGQEEYHVLHSAFLAGSESGKATIFVLVFKLPLEFGHNETGVARASLMYWLRMVAYSSLPGVKRHVMIVVNNFEGCEVPATFLKQSWERLIGGCKERFGQLILPAEPFIINVRDPAAVEPLKRVLFEKARTLLQDVSVPRIFFDLQMELKHWSERKENKGLPILTWDAFQNSKLNENSWTVETLESAASYLHEIGEIIYLKKADPNEGSTLRGPVYLKRSIVVPNPEWFCKNIVGELLLPQEALLEGENWVRNLLKPDGSISILDFEFFFKAKLVKGTESEDVISMLEEVGLCFRRGEDEIVIPALIDGDDYASIKWASKEGNEVIGRCLSSEDQEGNDARQEQLKDGQEGDHEDEGRKYFIPDALFRRLQVELAHDPKFGRRTDSKYKVGKSFLSFELGPLLVLVQSDVDKSSSVDDRIDILVEIGKDSAKLELKAVEFICEIMQKVQDLCVDVCPGLRYAIKVIEPASTLKNFHQMIDRNLMSLEEIKGRIIRGEQDLAWKTVGGKFVQIETCLSQSELRELVDRVKVQLSRDLRTAKDKYDECQKDMKAMGIRTVEASDEGSSSQDTHNQFRTSGSNDQEGLDKEAFLINHISQLEDRIIGHLKIMEDSLVRHMDKKFAELQSELSEFRQKHDRLLKEVQAQRALFIGEKTSSVPRYIYLTRKQKQASWISIKDVLSSIKDVLSIDYELHFLCEAHFENGHVHEVKEQGGIELSRPKTWWVDAAPWLRRSLQVAVIVGKTVGNLYLPGVFNWIPDVLTLDSDLLAKAVDRAATDLGAEGIGAQMVNLQEKPIAEAVVSDLRDELSKTDVAKKIGLVRMTLRELYEGTSNQAQLPVFWICNDCARGYGNKVQRI